MDVMLFVLLLLALIGVSNIIHHFIPFIPIPLIQIALGILVVIVWPDLYILLEPELFFVLFIAPLLFNDGMRFPREKLWHLRVPILLLALGLVFATVLVVGYGIHWMIPSIPLSAAFALAAILSPTDAVAVSAIAGRLHLPEDVMHLLEGEALMNDASGLVAFKFAIAATVTGFFSIQQATVSFLVIALGGLLTGALLAFLILQFRFYLRRMGMKDVTMHMLIQLLTPFAIYLLAEHFGFSGILAVVAGGIIHAIEQDRMRAAFTTRMRIVSESTWSVVLFILNGLVFVILGLEIPSVISVIWKDQSFNHYQMVFYILAISFALIALRFLWMFLFSEGRRRLFRKKKQEGTMKSQVLISLSGVRGAVTLAGAFSIPLVLQDGTPFPERNLIIFLSAGVILTTLCIASFFLPVVTNAEDSGDEDDTEEMHKELMEQEEKAKARVLRAILKALKEEVTEENGRAALDTIADYKKLLLHVYSNEYRTLGAWDARKKESTIYLAGIRAEKKELQRLLHEKEITPELAEHANHTLTHMEMLLSSGVGKRLVHSGASSLSRLRLFFHLHRHKKAGHNVLEQLEIIKKLKIQTCRVAIKEIQAGINDENRNTAMAVLGHYGDIIARLSVDPGPKDKEYEENRKQLQYKALQVGRDKIQSLYENGEITSQNAIKLRQYINQIEANMIEEESVFSIQ